MTVKHHASIRQMAQQSLALVLMVLISGLTFLHVFAHKRQQKEVKRFLERSVGMALSEDLFLPATAEFEHLKKGDEIVLGGNKYDILKVTAVQGGYRVKAFNDKIEKALEDQIAQQCEQGSGESSKGKPIWFDKLHWAVSDVGDEIKSPRMLAVNLGLHDSLNLPEQLMPVSVPPPQG